MCSIREHTNFVIELDSSVIQLIALKYDHAYNMEKCWN